MVSLPEHGEQEVYEANSSQEDAPNHKRNKLVSVSVSKLGHSCVHFVNISLLFCYTLLVKLLLKWLCGAHWLWENNN